jgi:hypothetical protein
MPGARTDDDVICCRGDGHAGPILFHFMEKAVVGFARLSVCFIPDGNLGAHDIYLGWRRWGEYGVGVIAMYFIMAYIHTCIVI